MGLTALFDAACQWLNNAAANELHCPVQGWEHVRRDNTKGLIHADTHVIRADLDTSTDVVKFYNYRYYRVGSSEDLLMGELITPVWGHLILHLRRKIWELTRIHPFVTLLACYSGQKTGRSLTNTGLNQCMILAAYVGLQKGWACSTPLTLG